MTGWGFVHASQTSLDQDVNHVPPVTSDQSVNTRSEFRPELSMTIRGMLKYSHPLPGMDWPSGDHILDIQAIGIIKGLTWCAKPWVSKVDSKDGQGLTADTPIHTWHHATINTNRRTLIVVPQPPACQNAQLPPTITMAMPLLPQLNAQKISDCHIKFSAILREEL